jgi:hypothetical protein
MSVADDVFRLQRLDREPAAAPAAAAEVEENNMVISREGLEAWQQVAMTDIGAAMENYQ